jgi:hypothetical protein
MKELFDSPPSSYRFKNYFDCQIWVGAKVRRGFPIVEFENDNSNRSIGDTRCRQEGLEMT